MKTTEIDFSRLPSVEQLLQTGEARELIAEFGRGLVLSGLRAELDAAREKGRRGQELPDAANILRYSRKRIEKAAAPSLTPVINASGVVLHTNLGRAPLSRKARRAAADTGACYSNLEFDLENGKRGSRICHVEKVITDVTGAEAAFVVGNNAAAVLLCLSALARRKRVVISRTQMVEIGDGFRIPDVLAQSGARLVEIGTTNKVHAQDYIQALEDPAGAVLRVHHSNFKLTGFTSEPSLTEIVAAARGKGTLVIDNLGSGALVDTARYGMGHEPMVQESLQGGADLVCFSGDKLVGGPQAGIIVGRKELIQKIRRHPLARAVRADKLCLAALAETFLHYLREESEKEIPIWRMIATSLDELKQRAVTWNKAFGNGEIVSGHSTVGGGSLPEEVLPTWLFSLKVPHPDQFSKKLRRGKPPIIARIENERLIFDPRTVFPEQEEEFIAGVQAVLSHHEKMDGLNES